MEKQPEQYSSYIAEIEEMVAKDQVMRTTFQETKQWNSEIDAHNTQRAKEIIAEIGWPTISKVGKSASHLFWLLIQHADQQLDFQKECLEIMKSLPKEEIQQSDIAYLEDRVRGSEGKHQLYGTQFGTDPETGVYGAIPIEDIEHLDERRAALGMIPFSEYEIKMKGRFGPKNE